MPRAWPETERILREVLRAIGTDSVTFSLMADMHEQADSDRSLWLRRAAATVSYFD